MVSLLALGEEFYSCFSVSGLLLVFVCVTNWYSKEARQDSRSFVVPSCPGSQLWDIIVCLWPALVQRCLSRGESRWTCSICIYTRTLVRAGMCLVMYVMS